MYKNIAMNLDFIPYQRFNESWQLDLFLIPWHHGK